MNLWIIRVFFCVGGGGSLQGMSDVGSIGTKVQ